MDSLFTLKHTKTSVPKLSSLLLCLILSACDNNGGNEQLMQFSISTSSGGSAVASHEMVTLGGSVSLTLSPDDGYTLANVSGCNGQLKQNTSPLTYTISNFSPDCSVEVEFLPLYPLSPIISGAGTISPDSAEVMHGQSTSFIISPDVGHTIASVSGCGGSLSDNTYTTAALTAACAIQVNFIAQHLVRLNALQNGSLSFSQSGHSTNTNTRLVNEGEQISLNISPETGFVLQSVSGCNGSLNGMVYTTAPINGPCTISAVFRQQHRLTISPLSNGSIRPSNISILDGNSATFTVTPDTGYVIDRVTGCTGSLNGNTYTTGVISAPCSISASFRAQHTLNVNAGGNGSVTPNTATVLDGDSLEFTVTPDNGYAIASVTGCAGSLNGNTYTTGAINATCSINASFLPVHTVTASAGSHGNITPASNTVMQGQSTSVTVTADSGFIIDTVTGCGGNLVGTSYTTRAITGPCTITASFTVPFDAAALSANFSSNQRIEFTWPVVAGAGYYRMLENPDGSSGFSQIGNDLSAADLGATPSYTKTLGVNFKTSAEYLLQSCLGTICVDSNPVSVLGDINDTISYIKASNPQIDDGFGYALALSEDASTLAVGAYQEDGDGTRTDGDDSNNDSTDSGAVYVFTKNNHNWVQQAYLKSSSTEISGNFGYALALSNDGNTLAVGALGESHNGQPEAGAVHLFKRSGTTWSHRQRLSAAHPGNADAFGKAVALSGSGDRLVVSAPVEASNASGIDGDATNNSANEAGAAYIFEHNIGTWIQQHYLKASNSEAEDYFGYDVSISDDGDTIAVSAFAESSASANDQSDNSANLSGAVYVFAYNDGWTQQAYLKADVIGPADFFGYSVSLDEDGDTLAVGAPLEDSSSQGMGGDPSINAAFTSGAAYVFSRSGSNWSQQAYFKASNSGPNDTFGHDVSLSHDGTLLAVGAGQESSNAKGIDGDQNNNGATYSGAAYLFERSNGNWTQNKYLKASNSAAHHVFGQFLELSGDGRVLGVAAHYEASNDAGDQNNHAAPGAGAVYLY